MNECNDMNRLLTPEINGLLKFCIESTGSISNGNLPLGVRPEDITQENREYLRQALENCSADWEYRKLVVECIICLTEVEIVSEKGSDVTRQEKALALIEDWAYNTEMINDFYVLGWHPGSAAVHVLAAPLPCGGVNERCGCDRPQQPAPEPGTPA